MFIMVNHPIKLLINYANCLLVPETRIPRWLRAVLPQADAMFPYRSYDHGTPSWPYSDVSRETWRCGYNSALGPGYGSEARRRTV